jgi:serine protease
MSARCGVFSGDSMRALVIVLECTEMKLAPYRSLAVSALALTLCGSVLAQQATSAPARVIVQFKPESTMAGKQVQSIDRVRTLSSRLAAPVAVNTGPAPQMHQVSAEGYTAQDLAEALSAQDDVLFAVPDRRKTIRLVPNDPRYGEQWLLQTAQPGAINAEGAWDLNTGQADAIIAVIDTGARFDHEDLSERFLPGYDFITDPATAGDGDGRDADALDPGDFLTAQDLQGAFQGCGDGANNDQPTSSSWHGTQVAGVVAATGNNSRGIAGVSWAARILPVRALGKCGGVDSDIIAAMRWAGGLPVPGAPENPHPARVINMSLGGNNGCSAPYLLTIAELNQAGVSVVASAGNSGASVEEPGNCPGVITVAGLRNAGAKVGFSSFGPDVDISAPAGNCGSEGPSCAFQIPTTTNLGATTAGANGYSDGLNPTLGTSFSAPLASGTIALMLSIHPGLGPDEQAQRLKSSARAFVAEQGIPVCPATAVDSGQCNCTTETCGAGMLDAAGAAQAALAPQARASATESDGQVTLDGTASSASAGRNIVSWQWRQAGGPAAVAFAQAQAATTALQAPIAGSYSVELAVTDSAGQTDSGEFTITLNQPSVIPPAPEPAPDPTPAPAPEDGVKKRRSGGGGPVDPITLAALLALAAAAYGVRRQRHAPRIVTPSRPPR